MDSFGYTLKSGIAGSYDKTTFTFLSTSTLISKGTTVVCTWTNNGLLFVIYYFDLSNSEYGRMTSKSIFNSIWKFKNITVIFQGVLQLNCVIMTQVTTYHQDTLITSGYCNKL